MTSGVKTVVYPVRDLAQAKALYGTLLGVEPDMDEAYYVGFRVAGQDIGLDPHDHSKGLTGPVSYWHVDDIDERLTVLLDAGAVEQQAIQDVGGGKLVHRQPTQTATSSDSSRHCECPRVTAPARPKEQRQQDALNRLEHDLDPWVAIADGKRGPHIRFGCPSSG